jgi:hypothetical protein
LVTRSERPFEWGQWDCNLFITDLLDHLDGGNRSAEIRGKYNTLRSALKFQNKYTPAPEFLMINGFDVKKKSQTEFKDHDIVLVETKGYWSARLFFNGFLWSVVEDHAMMIFEMEPGNYLVGEYNGK